MASTLTRKRPRTAAKARRENHASVNERYLVDAHGKRVAVVLPLAEYQRIILPPADFILPKNSRMGLKRQDPKGSMTFRVSSFHAEHASLILFFAC